MALNYRHHSYNDGRKKEELVIEFLTNKFGNCEKSSMDDDINRDIDCYVVDKKNREHTVSIKVQHNCARLDNLGLETWQFVDDWQPTGWYFTGEAEFYVVWNKDGVVVQYNKKKLAEALAANTLTVYRRQLKEETSVLQKAIGHMVIDAESVYLERSELVAKGIGRVLGTLEYKGMPTPINPKAKPILRKHG